MESQDMKYNDQDGMPVIKEGHDLKYSYFELFKPLKKVGSGAYGNVYLVETKIGKRKLAVKVVDIENKTETELEANYCKSEPLFLRKI